MVCTDKGRRSQQVGLLAHTHVRTHRGWCSTMCKLQHNCPSRGPREPMKMQRVDDHMHAYKNPSHSICSGHTVDQCLRHYQSSAAFHGARSLPRRPRSRCAAVPLLLRRYESHISQKDFHICKDAYIIGMHGLSGDRCLFACIAICRGGRGGRDLRQGGRRPA